MGPKAIRNIEKKKESDRNKSVFINYYFKCKWIKLSNQRTDIGRMDKNL